MPGLNSMGPAGAGPGTGNRRGRCRNMAISTETIGWGAGKGGRRLRDGSGYSYRRRWMQLRADEQGKKGSTAE